MVRQVAVNHPGNQLQVRVLSSEPFCPTPGKTSAGVEIMCSVIGSTLAVAGRRCWFESNYVVGVRFCSSSFKSELSTIVNK